MEEKLKRRLDYAEQLARQTERGTAQLVGEFIAHAVDFWEIGNDDAADLFSRRAVEVAEAGVTHA